VAANGLISKLNDRFARDPGKKTLPSLARGDRKCRWTHCESGGELIDRDESRCWCDGCCCE